MSLTKNSKPIAVFSSSDIQGPEKVVRSMLPDAAIRGIINTRDNSSYYFASWGILEEALKKGYHVYVVTTRDCFGTHDEWWMDLVGKDNIFSLGNPAGANDKDAIQKYQTFLTDVLGIEEHPHPATWMDCEQKAYDKGCAKAWDFRKKEAS